MLIFLFFKLEKKKFYCVILTNFAYFFGKKNPQFFNIKNLKIKSLGRSFSQLCKQVLTEKWMFLVRVKYMKTNYWSKNKGWQWGWCKWFTELQLQMVINSFGNQKYMQPMGRLKHALKVPWFFLFQVLVGAGGGGGESFFHFFFVPFMFLSSSLWIPNMFPKFQMCSPRVFLIASGFNPICFAQSPPHLTYIHEPKGKALHLAIESSILGELP